MNAAKRLTGKFKSSGRVRTLVMAVPTWYPTSSPGRAVAPIPQPRAFVRPLQQYAVHTPSKKHESGSPRTRPRLGHYGIVRLIREVWAILGRIKLSDKGVQRVRLRRIHARARDVCCDFRPLLANSYLEVVLG